jgi:hypothetical protein
MKRVQEHVLDELKEHVEKLPPRRNLRPYDIVAELLELYSGARARGYNLDDFVLVLERHGIKLTRTTLRNYISRARSAQRKLADGSARVGSQVVPRHAAPAAAVVVPTPKPTAAMDPAPPAPAPSTNEASASAVPHSAPVSNSAAPKPSTTKPAEAQPAPRGYFQPRPDSDDI